MKAVFVIALILSSFASFATSSTKYSNVGDCQSSQRDIPSWNVNFGLPVSYETIYCVSYHQVTVSSYCMRDPESRTCDYSIPLRHDRSESNERSCYRDGIFSNAQTKCESARAQMLGLR